LLPTYSFFTEAQRITAEEYVPSIEDIRHTAERGIVETYFDTNELSIRVLQIYGGLECGWRKWIHLFEGVTSIIFYAPLSDYDRWVVGSDEQVCIFRLLTMFVTNRS
jgi:guanine nucleotide-binding protein G(i) subunit alpha